MVTPAYLSTQRLKQENCYKEPGQTEHIVVNSKTRTHACMHNTKISFSSFILSFNSLTKMMILLFTKLCDLT